MGLSTKGPITPWKGSWAQRSKANHSVPAQETTEEDTKPDWTRHCEVCGEKPIVPITGMCGPCTFGEAETAGGNW